MELVPQPELEARKSIDRLLTPAGWVVCDAARADIFVYAVGVCEKDKTDSRPMEEKPTVSFEKLMQAVARNKQGGLRYARS